VIATFQAFDPVLQAVQHVPLSKQPQATIFCHSSASLARARLALPGDRLVPPCTGAQVWPAHAGLQDWAVAASNVRLLPKRPQGRLLRIVLRQRVLGVGVAGGRQRQ
jgi:hypothetical protein